MYKYFESKVYMYKTNQRKKVKNIIYDFTDNELAIEMYEQNCIERNVTMFIFVQDVI